MKTASKSKAWIIELAGTGRYRFRLVERGGTTIKPRGDLAAIKIPDSTPEIVAAYALGDEQALLAKVRYNRLIDIFLGLTTYSLQNHLRTQVRGMGQIEIDEIYVGINRAGRSVRDSCSGERRIGQAFAWCRPRRILLALRPNFQT